MIADPILNLEEEVSQLWNLSELNYKIRERITETKKREELIKSDSKRIFKKSRGNITQIGYEVASLPITPSQEDESNVNQMEERSQEETFHQYLRY
jgi:hypothetical protein